MKIATWNIYWLGDTTGKITRAETDHELIAKVIKKISPDVLALEEIVNPLIMENILKLASGDGKDYVIRSDDGKWLTSDSDPTNKSKNLQKIFLCINRETIEFLHGAEIRGGPAGRRSYAALLRHKASDTKFVAVAIHLRAGFPDFLNEDDAAFRKQEAEALARWLQGQSETENPSFPKPDSDKIVVLGDFNAEFNDPNQSLNPLREGELSNWMWNNPKPDGVHRETAIDDRYVIDFIMLSPALKIEPPPTIYAWDYDSSLGGATKFHEEVNGSNNLKNYKVSDHRLVFVVLDFQP